MTISKVIGIPNVGEQWNKGQYVDSIMKRIKVKLNKGLKKAKRERPWMKHHWPIKAPNKDHSCQISRNLEHFLSFLEFLNAKIRFFFF